MEPHELMSSTPVNSFWYTPNISNLMTISDLYIIVIVFTQLHMSNCSIVIYPNKILLKKQKQYSSNSGDLHVIDCMHWEL